MTADPRPATNQFGDFAPGSRRISRRGLLQFGSLAGLALPLGGLALTQAAAADSARRPVAGNPLKSCILIFCNGGPSHIDTFDMKPAAPAEVRGEFQPIPTSLTGCAVCEHLPNTARLMHRLTLIRSMQHRMRGHRSGVTNSLCGLPPPSGDVCTIPPEQEQLPSYGSRLTWLLRDRGRGPSLPHVALPYTIRDSGIVLPGQSAGFLGPRYQRFQIEKDPDATDFGVTSVSLPHDVTLARLEHRESLLKLLDGQSDELPRGESVRHMQACYGRAFGLLSSEGVRAAFELSRETPRIRERYGRNIVGQSVLLARRLVEAGVQFVNVNIGDQQNEWYWDDHKSNFPGHRRKLAPFDLAFSSLIDDLADRSLLDSTLVIALGEFGRTPKINPDAGRDHWPDCYTAVLAGGGAREGMIHGASDRIGAYPVSDPVGPADLAATLFSRFDFDPATEIFDHTGRPFRLAEGTPISGLFANEMLPGK
ncbi:MAG: DUF1501 domain-containing protein [Planctomycetia bacterium]|nr:DUF1501 domain-containing protein [Planctomycetia bacterium]